MWYICMLRTVSQCYFISFVHPLLGAALQLLSLLDETLFCSVWQRLIINSLKYPKIYFAWSMRHFAKIQLHSQEYFLIGVHYRQGWTATTRSGKKATKRRRKSCKTEWICSINTCHSNTNRKDLTRLHFEGEQRVWKKQKVKVQQSYISVSVVHQTYPSSSWKHQPIYDNSIQSHMVYLQR